MVLGDIVGFFIEGLGLVVFLRVCYRLGIFGLRLVFIFFRCFYLVVIW